MLVDHNTCCHGITAQPDIIHDISLQCLIQFLVNHGHSIIQCFSGIFEIDFLAFQFDLACILTVDAEQTLH